MASIAEFIDRAGVSMTCKRVDRNPNMPDADMNHYLCVLQRGQRGVDYAQMRVYFSMGVAHKKPPTVANVLDCLASDASCANETFEQWCAEFGYDADSRSAERTYNAVRKQTASLRAFLGSDTDALIYETDRQ